LVVGTRPELIKMAPVIRACRDRARQLEPIVCLTGQHREMLTPLVDYFDVQPDIDLEVMQPDQTLAGLTARCLARLDEVIVQREPDCIVAQGDTTTVLAASMSAFFRRLPFVHVEAGLRTGDMQSPWPEEYNRRAAALAATLHCAPTERAADNLLAEGVHPDCIQVTGNTVIDALEWTVARQKFDSHRIAEHFGFAADRRMVLITGHRRENFGGPFEAICRAINRLAGMFPDTDFVYPVHLNPNVRGPAHALLSGRDNIHLLDPAGYPEFVWLMNRATLILTDSGGVQEEAPSLRKPVLVMRDTTERPEAVAAGAVELVGTTEIAVVRAASTLLTNPAEYARRQLDYNPYGDGRAAERIVDLMTERAAQQYRRAA
jgi:UDP-N-acetylglucosamine 2-epimerase (non-hydrolysing)